ncbi:hypothetical protein AMAG_17939 [Allomyces macrogynus ATCC 38327]|uniref:Uncharacterized protein n=1 Tax=Allomyces macrogynus (strain ATCC 38327) TaxID=578462 RepID=A0A0L0S2G9_ALLM3|nr:hypothetical protein AMAG_17939 [Allomyces macrogynus ATCC 38327]|eukprot:KNE56595.1 hypothetical protein AMAG_17939 [Allomyces macrogynus ATCC 38327]
MFRFVDPGHKSVVTVLELNHNELQAVIDNPLRAMPEDGADAEAIAASESDAAQHNRLLEAYCPHSQRDNSHPRYEQKFWSISGQQLREKQGKTQCSRCLAKFMKRGMLHEFAQAVVQDARSRQAPCRGRVPDGVVAVRSPAHAEQLSCQPPVPCRQCRPRLLRPARRAVHGLARPDAPRVGVDGQLWPLQLAWRVGAHQAHGPVPDPRWRSRCLARRVLVEQEVLVMRVGHAERPPPVELEALPHVQADPHTRSKRACESHQDRRARRAGRAVPAALAGPRAPAVRAAAACERRADWR